MSDRLTADERRRLQIVDQRLIDEAAAITAARAFEDEPFADLGASRRELARRQQRRLDIRSSDTQYLEFLMALVKRLAAGEQEPY